MTAASELHWFTSSYSGGSGTECVEAALIPTGILIRDSKRPEGPLVEVSDAAWCWFLAASLKR
jgi:hypothetical protein